MRKNTRPLWILANLLLLLVSGIQAITPDAGSLASTNALIIVSQLAADSRLASDVADSGCLATCELVRPSRSLHSRKDAGEDLRFIFSCDFSRTPFGGSSVSVSFALHMRTPASDRLFQALCRMVC